MTPGLLTLLLLALLVAPLGLVLLLALRAARAAVREFHPPRGPVPRPAPGAEAPWVAALQDASFQSSTGAVLRGWYLPSKSGAAVVAVHGTESDRRALLGLLPLLWTEGLGVLLYDGPGCGESTGSVTWGPEERAALIAAVDWLTRAPGVDPARLGLFGFSQGAYVGLQAAAGEPRLRAVLLEGAIADYRDQTAHEFGARGPLSRLPALWARSRAAPWAADATPLQLVARVAPRPILFIHGADDAVVPRAASERLLAAAGEPKRLVLIPGAHHGDCGSVDPQGYGELVRGFFREHLGGARSAAAR